MNKPSPRTDARRALLQSHYPEAAAGGFSRVDGAIEFYTRVNALLSADAVVLDYGAGRAHWYHDDPVESRRHLRLLRGKVAEVIGVDLDPVVLQNPALDRALVVEPGAPLPLPDGSVDLVLSDFTFEHVQDPAPFAREIARVVRPGGWVCARTPNRWGLTATGASLVPNRWHSRALSRLQPGRLAEDVFPTVYALNTKARLRRHFPDDVWRHIVYGINPEPLYFGNSRAAWVTVKTLNKHLPEALAATWLIFLQRR